MVMVQVKMEDNPVAPWADVMHVNKAEEQMVRQISGLNCGISFLRKIKTCL